MQAGAEPVKSSHNYHIGKRALPRMLHWPVRVWTVAYCSSLLARDL